MQEKRKGREWGKSLPTWLKALIFALIATILTIALKKCVGAKADNVAVNQSFLNNISKRKNNPVNILLQDSCVRILKQGDIVFRKGNDATSDMLCLLNLTDKTYSHCGIIAIENGYPFVYHSIGGEDNPDAKLRRDSAGFWFTPANNNMVGIARTDMKDEEKNRTGELLRWFYKEKIKFDMKFDLRSDDRFYCAELVYKAIIQATGNKEYFKPVTAFGFRYIGIDNLYLNPHCKTVCQVRYK
jgi:hypothetical protein